MLFAANITVEQEVIVAAIMIAFFIFTHRDTGTVVGQGGQ